jgi:hypothetical protein
MNPKKQLGLETSVIEYHLCICFELGPACWRKTLQLLAFKDWRLSALSINRAHVIWKWHQKKFWIYFRLMMSYGFPRLWCQSRKQFVFIRTHLYIYICEAYKNRNCPRSTRPGWNPVWEKLFGECFCHCQRLYCMMMIIMITAKKCSILSLFFLLSFHMPQLQLESDAQCLI